jgi:hypothetical protein
LNVVVELDTVQVKENPICQVSRRSRGVYATEETFASTADDSIRTNNQVSCMTLAAGKDRRALTGLILDLDHAAIGVDLGT